MSDLDTIITQLATVIGGVSDVAVAYEHPPEQLNEFPAAVIYVSEGAFNYGASLGCIGLHVLIVDLHLARSLLPHDEAIARPFIESITKALAASVTLSGTCEHCLVRTYRYGAIGYGDQQTMGIRFNVEVKTQHSGFTVSA